MALTKRKLDDYFPNLQFLVDGLSEHLGLRKIDLEVG